MDGSLKKINNLRGEKAAFIENRLDYLLTMINFNKCKFCSEFESRKGIDLK